MRRKSSMRKVIHPLFGPASIRMLLFAFLSFLALVVPGTSTAHPREPADAGWRGTRTVQETLTGMGPLLAQRNDRYRNRYEQWQRMNPVEKDTLRRRMDQWNRMDPQDRQRYQHRFDQWKGLSPEEQSQIDGQLDRWKDLSPAEKEDVRRKFR